VLPNDNRRIHAELTQLLRQCSDPGPFDAVDWDQLHARIVLACRTAVVDPAPHSNGNAPRKP
jgi:hypothetical protein